MNSSVFLTSTPARGSSIILIVAFLVVFVAFVWIPILNNPKQFKDKRTVITACVYTGIGLVFAVTLNSVSGITSSILMMVLILAVSIIVIKKSPRTKNQANQTSPTETVRANGSSIDKLTKLKELLDAGAITQEEFDAKKKEILNL